MHKLKLMADFKPSKIAVATSWTVFVASCVRFPWLDSQAESQK